MPRRRRYSTQPFGPTVEKLMAETATTYRALAAKTDLSAGYLNHLVHGNRPVPSSAVIERLAQALDVEPDHFREVRVGAVIDHLEASPDEIDRLFQRLVRT